MPRGDKNWSFGNGTINWTEVRFLCRFQSARLFERKLQTRILVWTTRLQACILALLE